MTRLPSLLLLTALVSLSPSSSVAKADTTASIPQWIWVDALPRRGQTAFFRRSFSLQSPLKRAELRGLADDEMTVSLNGRQVAKVRDAKQFKVADVTQFVRQGTNVLTIRALNHDGPAGVLLRLRLVFADGRRRVINTDHRWRVASSEMSEGDTGALNRHGWSAAHSFGLMGVSPWGQPDIIPDDYNQWREALDETAATDAVSLKVAPGFRAELLRSARAGEDSWISMAFDSRGRLIIAREKRGLIRLTLSNDHKSVVSVETIDDTLEECRGLLFAFDSLYANANNSKALYRLRDTNGDDRFDEVKLLKETGGGVGHGRNDLVLGPDNMIYVVHGDNALPPDGLAHTSPHQHYANDRLRPCAWDRLLFDAGVLPPAGHILRTDRDGKKWELFAGGFRNPYGADFNAEGELFTFDADNEGDLNQPWYRPTRINHVVSGGEYGFRQGTANRPAFYPDTLPANLNMGIGSPTSVKFGTRSHFPAPYQQALFVLDWAYGRIFAVHLTPRGASYVGRAETFLEGRPLNVTDLDFGPDGAMYFVTGGRGTQSGLYRVTCAAPGEIDQSSYAADQADAKEAAKARALRRRLESLHGRQDDRAVDLAWPHLDCEDPWLRHAARIAVEHQPAASWQDRALRSHFKTRLWVKSTQKNKRLSEPTEGFETTSSESRPTAAVTALLALCRVGQPSLRPRILARLDELPLDPNDPKELLLIVRTYAVCFARMGRCDNDTAARIVDRLGPLFPNGCYAVNRLLCELLVYLDAADVAAKTMQLMTSAPNQQERLFYLYVLRNVKNGWTPELRESYFRSLHEADEFEGGNMLPIITNSMKIEALSWLSDGEREQAASILYSKPATARDVEPQADRPFVRQWQLDDLIDSLPDVGRRRRFERGYEMFAAAACHRCHKIGQRGASIGPDLTGIGRRFSRKDLLESIIATSKVVDEKYRNVMITTDDGRTIVGRIVGGDDRHVVISTDPLAPHKVSRVASANIEAQKQSPVSPMPLGLLNTLTKEEILDLLAYLESGGDRSHPGFQEQGDSRLPSQRTVKP